MWRRALGVGIMAFAAACVVGDRDAPVGHTPADGEETPPPRVDTVEEGACELDGEIRGCKIYIDERNCFTGEQRCEDGEWSICDEPFEDDEI